MLALGGAAGVAAAGGWSTGSARAREAAGTDRAFVLHFDWSEPPKLSYGAGCLVVVNSWGSRHFPQDILQIRTQDAEVLEYTLPVHDYPWDDGTNDGIGEHVRFYTGKDGDVYRRSDIPTEWYWDPADPDRVVVPAYDGRVMDLRPDSPWLNHLLDDYYPWRLADSAWGLDGFQLDVLGDGYLGWVSGASQAELDEMAEGMRWFMRAIRDVVGDECILFNNNYWLDDNAHTDGIMLENHAGDEIGDDLWVAALARVTRTTRRRNVTTNPVAADACEWAKVEGVDHAGYWIDSYDIGPDVPFGPCGLGNNGWPDSANHIHLWDSTTFRNTPS
ncbi:MAG TPA: hypothetical protein VE172_12890 [Stackebrandtia sp.]|jgi:hypothetical protein|uniref:hypothetical protein n=1 Tax=Stackebrandtia sp. TaxID=2023065 RepID=UPI002D6A51B2|nr:hypothetical protein [Stackebrandtia sp.]HZE39697.1 hypothetical protein [Stackebrandtia sp.]